MLDGKTGKPRYLGQAQFQQAMDVAAVKLFVTNRNGVEPVDVILRDLTIRADRVNGLGTDRPHRLRPGRLCRPDVDREGHPDRRRSAQDAAGRRAECPAGRTGTRSSAGRRRRPVLSRRGPARSCAGRRAGGRDGGRRSGGRPDRRGGRPVAPAAASRAAPAPAPATAAAPKRRQASRRSTARRPRTPPEPKAKIPLEEIESIHFERSPGMTARFVGQPNLDFTMPGLSYKPEEAKKDDFPDDVFAPDPKDPKYLADQKAAEKKAEPKKEEPKKADAKKAEEKKAEEADDVNAPPPGTTAPTKIARVEPEEERHPRPEPGALQPATRRRSSR